MKTGMITDIAKMIAIGCLTVAVGSRPVSAKIYRLWGRADVDAIGSGNLPGELIYDSAARLNGIDGRTRVQRYDIDFAMLQTALREGPPGDKEPAVRWMVGERHALGIAAGGQRTLLLGLPAGNAVLGIRFEPAAGRRRPAAGIPAGMPVYPGVEPEWSMELHESGLAVYTAVVNDFPATVASHFERILRQSGWQPALESSGAKVPGSWGGRIYLKGDALMAVQVGHDRGWNATTQLTVLRKQR